MENQEKASILNDLVQINNDRIEGYHKASEQLKNEDAEVSSLFGRMAEESRTYKSELVDKIRSLGEEPAKDTTALGKIYRAWMDVKATFTGHDLVSILGACEFGEDAAQTAYKNALADDDLTGDVRLLITTQKESLKKSHDTIKQYRDRLAS